MGVKIEHKKAIFEFMREAERKIESDAIFGGL